MTFDFFTPVGEFSIVGYQASDSNGDGIAPAATFEGYDENGALIASISTSFDPFSPIDISGILGTTSVSSVTMAMDLDNILVGAILIEEPQGAPVVSCNGFAAPFDKDLLIKNRSKRTIPVVMTLTNTDGVELTDQDIISPPVVTIAFNSSVAGTGSISDDSLLDPATSSQGNTFSYNVDTLAWEYRLSSRNLSSAGTYTVSVASGDDTEYVVDTTTQCTQSFTRLP